MNNTESPDILDALHDLLGDDPSLLLLYALTDAKQYAQIISIGILLHHIDIRACLDCLVKPYGVGTAYHSMDSNFFVNTSKVLLRYVCNLHDFACVDLLAWVDR